MFMETLSFAKKRNITEVIVMAKFTVKFGTVGWDNMMDIFKKYREAGYKIYD